MLTRLIEALGIDPVQCRALTVAYVRMDLRAAGGAVGARSAGRGNASAMVGILIVVLIGSMVFAWLASTIKDVLLSASLLTSYGAANTMMLLLVDFTSLVVSPHDYGVLGHRPVGSRTYFAARLLCVAVYISAVSVVLGFLPACAYAYRVGLLAFPATLLAVGLCNLSATVVIIALYAWLLGRVHPARLRRALSYLQLVASMSFYGAYYLATTAFTTSFVARLGFSSAPWLWLIPSSWFAAFVTLSAGSAPGSVWAASAAGLALAACCVPLASGRLSLDYARRLGEISTAAEPLRERRTSFHLPGFGRDEARAVALLVRAQFRFDQRFRMAILGILPLTVFYLLLGVKDGALRDPFVPGQRAPGPTMYFAIVFVPMTLHAALSSSESWRAAWLFFAAPASYARIVVAAKNFVAVYFLGTYLVVLAAIWSFFFDRLWHAAVHAVFIGLLAHMLLQFVVIAKPVLPFANEPRHAERSSPLFVAFMVAGIIASLVPMLLPLVYRRPVLAASALTFLLAATAGLEYALRLRVEEALGQLEFRS